MAVRQLLRCEIMIGRAAVEQFAECHTNLAAFTKRVF